MTPIRFGRLIVLACMGLAVACTTGTEGGTAGNTELNLDIVNPGGTSGELGFSIDRVDYRITCDGNPPGTYPLPDADTSGTDYNYDDSVDISGAFEVVDTRVPPVWQAVMDLPPGDCTITLSVYEDDEIVCVGSQTLAILEDGTTKYDIVLVCSLSVDLPDGMADVDGTFEFITGNLCPKLYVLNAIPSTIVQDVSNPNAQTEIQYRAKDPDNTCGNNCDPQTCDFSNPPVCSPYPSNINDPACNPAFGGDPNSVDCQAGVYAGLVCTIAAIPSSTPGVPGGTFLSPLDGVSPIGPVFPVNLNLASGTPGVILPGMGGPAGTNAANSPAYPPATIGNFNGSLPPLFYQCDITLPGPVLINLDCSDGDAECDQNNQLVVECPGNNFCVSDPIICDSGNECTSNGTCDPNCDSGDIGGPDCPAGTRCPGEGDDVPDGDACTVGGNVCVGGTCVECQVDADCTTSPAAVVPGTCQEPNTCNVASLGTCLGGGFEKCDVNADCPAGHDCNLGLPQLGTNLCVAGTASPAGATCGNGVCDGSGPPFGVSNPPCIFQAVDPPSQSLGITVGCANNATTDISILDFRLDVDPGPILSGDPVTVDLGGEASFVKSFLDAGLGLFPGLTRASLTALAATVEMRSGLTGPDVVLQADFSVLTVECSVSGAACVVDTDCAGFDFGEFCGAFIDLPTSNFCDSTFTPPGDGTCDNACDPGGLCETVDPVNGPVQCAANGYCVLGDLPLPLAPDTGSYTADVVGSSAAGVGAVLTGWWDAGQTGFPILGDGTYDLPGGAPQLSPLPELAVQVIAGPAAVGLECIMAVDSGGPDGVGVPDLASPTPDANLIPFNIQLP